MLSLLESSEDPNHCYVAQSILIPCSLSLFKGLQLLVLERQRWEPGKRMGTHPFWGNAVESYALIYVPFSNSNSSNVH